MATFKVGQRVKLLVNKPSGGPWPVQVPAGAVGTVTSPLMFVKPVNVNGLAHVYAVQFDGVSSGFRDGHFSCRPHEIVPLTDPKADAFMERIKKLEREPAPRIKEPA